jgi:transposase IS66-like protein
VLASLIETCKVHGVNPEAWLADVITSLVDNWPNSRLAELTPWAWQAAGNDLERPRSRRGVSATRRSDAIRPQKKQPKKPWGPMTAYNLPPLREITWQSGFLMPTT